MAPDHHELSMVGLFLIVAVLMGGALVAVIGRDRGAGETPKRRYVSECWWHGPLLVGVSAQLWTINYPTTVGRVIVAASTCAMVASSVAVEVLNRGRRKAAERAEQSDQEPPADDQRERAGTSDG